MIYNSPGNVGPEIFRVKSHDIIEVDQWIYKHDNDGCPCVSVTRTIFPKIHPFKLTSDEYAKL